MAKAADVYSFAVLLLEMWCGNAGFSNDSYHGVSFHPCYYNPFAPCGLIPKY